MNSHVWIRGGRRLERRRLLETQSLPPVLAELDAHRRLRGPYTAAGELLRTVLHDLVTREPAPGYDHRIEISTCAPELDGVVPATKSMEWLVERLERTRFYSRLHTLTIANGLAELLREHLISIGSRPRTLVFENVDQADPTDQEFVAVLLRRTDLPGLTVVVGSHPDTIADPPGEIGISLSTCLARHTRVLDAATATESVPPAQLNGGEGRAADRELLARVFVESDCADDDPRLIAGYAAIADSDRRRLHDERARTLIESAEPSLRRGPIPFHLERGGDPVEAGVPALWEAMELCRSTGLYQAAVDLGHRGQALVEAPDPWWWKFTEGLAVCLATLGRADESLAIYTDARAGTEDPEAHVGLAYGTAMLYARHYGDGRRDYQLARAWMNVSIALAGRLEDPKQRAFHTVFSGNGMALVDVRQNRYELALRRLDEGMTRLDAELATGEHALHRLVLRYNRAQVLGMLGRLEEALDDYVAVAKDDPLFPEHHFNIGTLLRRMNRPDEALEAYQRALDVSPPFAEGHYNLADTRLELGDLVGGLDAFSYTLQLDPDRVEAHLGRAATLQRLGEPDRAMEAVNFGLELAPTNARLLTLAGNLFAEAGDLQGGRRSVQAALTADPELGEAWALRAELAYAEGDLVSASTDFDRAVQLCDQPAVRFNRATVLQETGRFVEAAAEFEAVLAVTGDPEARAGLELCRAGAMSASQ